MKYLFAVFMLTMLLPLQVAAQDRAVIARGKAASALVELDDGKTAATAFCIHKSGIFVTNHHVVAKVKPGADVRLILDVATPAQRHLLATVIRTEADHDLALLRTKEPGEFEALQPGNSDDVFETMQTIVFGFPFGKELALKGGALPAISVSMGRITSIRRETDGIRLFQLDAEINPGNSGGAVLDNDGNVIGVVSFGVFATGINFAIPVHHLVELLQRPDVNAEYPAFTTQNLGESHAITVAVTPLIGTMAEPSLEVLLKPGNGQSIQIPMKLTDAGVFKGEFVPPADEHSASQPVNAQIRFESGRLEAGIIAGSFQIGDKTTNLSEVSMIRRQKSESKFLARLVDGSEHTGELQGLSAVTVDFGGTQTLLDLSKCVEVSIEHSTAAPTFEYTIIVKDAGKEVHRISTTKGIDGKAATASSVTSFQPYEGSKKSVALPGTITDVVAARGGRMLLVVMSQVKKLAIFDTNEAAIVKLIPLPTDNVLVAGTLDHAFIFDRTRNLIERWSLSSFEKEQTTRPPFDGVIKAVAAGSASPGPILVHWAGGTDALARADYMFLNADSLEDEKVTVAGNAHNGSFRDAVHIRASANGRVFGMWCTSHSPQGLGLSVLLDGKVQSMYEHDSVGHIVPGPDGTNIFTGIAGVYTGNLKRRFVDAATLAPCVPTTHSRLYLSFPAEPGAQRNLGADPFKGVAPALHVVDSRASLLTIPDLELGQDSENRSWSPSDFTLDKRAYYAVAANMLLSIPFTNDKIIVQRFELQQELEKSETDYFFVSSSPEVTFQTGMPYEYRIKVASRRPGVEFEMSSGPDGMQLSKQGVLSWNVPVGFSQDAVDVVVSIRNSADQTTYDSFTITRKR